MKKPYLIAGAVILVVLLVGGVFWYTEQSNRFMAQITQESAALFMPVIATTTPSVSAATTTPAKATTTIVTVTTRTTTTSTPVPNIISFKPAEATVGSTVTIEGVNFSRTANYINFGVSTGKHFADGSPDTQIAVVASPNGTTLTFNVPTSGPSGMLCDSNNHCNAVTGTRINPGRYPITVRAANGTSVESVFTVIAQ